MTKDRLTTIAYNLICGMEELLGFTSVDICDYCGMTNKEYCAIMDAELDNDTEDD